MLRDWLSDGQNYRSSDAVVFLIQNCSKLDIQI